MIVSLLLGMRWTHVSWKYMYFVSNKRELKKKWTISIGEDNALLTCNWYLNVLFWYLRKKKCNAKQKVFIKLSMVSHACYFKSVMQNTWPTSSGFVSQFYIPYKPIEPISYYTHGEKKQYVIIYQYVVYRKRNLIIHIY